MHGYLGTDELEAAKMQPFTPRVQGQESESWWAGSVKYGLSKAIDNTFQRFNNQIAGNTSPGSFAGQNGATYNQQGPAARPPAPASSSIMAGRIMGIPTIALVGVGLAVAAFIAFRR